MNMKLCAARWLCYVGIGIVTVDMAFWRFALVVALASMIDFLSNRIAKDAC